MAYTKLIDNLAIAIENQFREISTRYNFDYGEEFEIAICELLFKILPSRYGVCRGFVVTETDNFAGDDIIIYDRDRFPTLRLLEKEKFDKKQEIPVEAVYAYLEAKHTLFLSDKDSGQSIFKAFQQVHAVKSLPREKRGLLSVDPYTSLGEGFSAESTDSLNYTNPLFGAVISRLVKESSKGKEVASENILNLLEKSIVPINSLSPDLVILGQSDLLFPCISTEKEIIYDSPFFIEGVSTLIHKTTKTSSLAVGISMLLYALDKIKLDKMPFKKIIMQQVK